MVTRAGTCVVPRIVTPTIMRGPAEATALAEVGRALGLGIIGFQVEGARALEDLRRMGVDYAQGYAIGRPEPLAKALATLG